MADSRQRQGSNTSGHISNAIITLVSGLVVGILSVTYAISFSTIAFSGDLAFLLERAIGIGLFSAIVMAVITSLTASYPGTIGGPQDVAAAILALALGSAAASLPAGATPDQIYATAYSTLAVASFLTGVVFLGLGYFKLGNMVRFIPYPVMAGFLAATGWLLVKGALGLMAGVSLGLGNVDVLMDAKVMAVWIPGIVLGLLLLTCTGAFKQPLMLPGIIMGTLALFYVILMASGTSVADARGHGWLLGPFPGHGFTNSIDPSLIFQVDALPNIRTFIEIITVMVISIFGILLNVSGIEAATRKSVDLNRDLMSSSLANFVSSIGGGIVGYQQLSLTVLANRLGANNRIVGLLAACVCLLAFFYGASVLAYFPKLLVGGIVAFLGFDLLFGSLLKEWNKLPIIDFLIILMIVLVTATVGFLEGIAVGIIAGTAMFIVTYSKTDIVRQEFRGDKLRSNVDRPQLEEEILKEHGIGTVVLELQGFLFFGTASQFFDSAKEKIIDSQRRLNHVVIDFKRVTGLDSSAVHSFVKLAQITDDRNITLIFTGLSDDLTPRLFSKKPVIDGVASFKNLDGGIEWCEEDILTKSGQRGAHESKSLQDIFAADIFSPEEAEAAMDFLEECTFEPGDVLLQQGSPSDDIIFVEKGRVTVELVSPDGDSVRLRSMGPGTVVGEIGHYLGLPRTASVVADEACLARRLTLEALERMEREQPSLIGTFHKFMARRLSQKLADSTRLLEAVLK